MPSHDANAVAVIAVMFSSLVKLLFCCRVQLMLETNSAELRAAAVPTSIGCPPVVILLTSVRLDLVPGVRVSARFRVAVLVSVIRPIVLL